MSKCRKALDWEGMFRLALDPHVPRIRRSQSPAAAQPVCTMCGDLCAVKLHNEM
jgi:phosphomethylpyrimidine synthase